MYKAEELEKQYIQKGPFNCILFNGTIKVLGIGWRKYQIIKISYLHSGSFDKQKFVELDKEKRKFLVIENGKKTMEISYWLIEKINESNWKDFNKTYLFS